MSTSLEGRKAVVTGAAQGIGKAIAEALAAAGAKVVISDINGEGATAAAAEIGHGAVGVTCDSTDVAQVEKMLEDAAEDGAIDILVNNASIVPYIAWDDVDLAHWQKIIDTNLTSVFIASRKATDMMRAVGRKGTVLNIASNAFYAGTPNMSAYVAAKGGVVGFTRALATEVGKYGIRVNALAPGYFPTSMNEPMTQGEGRLESIISRIPLGRPGVPEDIAGVAVFLASRAGAYITGQSIGLDGGMAAW